jgi:hypothetical protein
VLEAGKVIALRVGLGDLRTRGLDQVRGQGLWGTGRLDGGKDLARGPLAIVSVGLAIGEGRGQSNWGIMPIRGSLVRGRAAGKAKAARGHGRVTRARPRGLVRSHAPVPRPASFTRGGT